MQSISVFNITNQEQFNNEVIVNFRRTWQEEINDIMENMHLDVFVLETISGYKRLHIRIDEPFPIRARVHDQQITEVIINSEFEGFVNEDNGCLILLANKKSSDLISSLISEELQIEYQRELFDLQTVILQSSNVKRTQFKDLRIETISGSSLSGNRVTDTEMYRIMLDAGQLSNIAVTYPTDEMDVEFSISTQGSIVLFSSLDIENILVFIQTLMVDLGV